MHGYTRLICGYIRLFCRCTGLFCGHTSSEGRGSRQSERLRRDTFLSMMPFVDVIFSPIFAPEDCHITHLILSKTLQHGLYCLTVCWHYFVFARFKMTVVQSLSVAICRGGLLASSTFPSSGGSSNNQLPNKREFIERTILQQYSNNTPTMANANAPHNSQNI